MSWELYGDEKFQLYALERDFKQFLIKNWVSCWVLFKGLGVQKCQGALLANIMAIYYTVFIVHPQQHKGPGAFREFFRFFFKKKISLFYLIFFKFLCTKYAILYENPPTPCPLGCTI